MDFITLREFRTQPGKVWKKLAKVRELVVTRNGKPFALLTETRPTKLEDDLHDSIEDTARWAIGFQQRGDENVGINDQPHVCPWLPCARHGFPR